MTTEKSTQPVNTCIKRRIHIKDDMRQTQHINYIGYGVGLHNGQGRPIVMVNIYVYKGAEMGCPEVHYHNHITRILVKPVRDKEFTYRP